MPTANKTPNLGLNNWGGTDKPKRSDFVEDNTLLDTIISSHMADKVAHLSADDRAAFENSIVTGLIEGNGQATSQIELPLSPCAVFVFYRDAPMSEYSADKKYTYVNAAVATTTGNTLGITMGGNQVKLMQSLAEPTVGSYFLNMNLKGGQYFYIAFR